MQQQLDRRNRPVVLVVDDDRTVRMLANRALTKAGFVFEEAADGEQGLAAFERVRPDLVMLDVEMPGLDGFSVCAQLRRLPAGQTVPILLATGLSDSESIDRAYEAGATDFVTKPVNWKILGHRLRYMLRNGEILIELAKSRISLANAQRIASVGNWEWDLLTDEVYWSDELYALLGANPGSMTAGLDAVLALVDRKNRRQLLRALIDPLKHGRASKGNLYIKRGGGAERVIYHQTEAVVDTHQQVVRLQGTLQDVTERQQAEEQIRYLAYFDSLTDLPNRQLFRERVANALNLARRHQRSLALLFLDLDNFKRINDTLGHNVGDRLLWAVADRLRASLRSSDGISHDRPCPRSDQVARFGGDEFLLLLSEIRRAEDAAKFARRVLKSVSEPIELSGHTVAVTPSIGIAVFPEDGANVDTLLRNADTAMYHAKRMGKNSYQFYNTGMNEAALKRLNMEQALQRALENGEFSLNYQPQLDLITDSIVGVEALLRWQSPLLGNVPPAEFIPLAEETGLIVPIGNWVLKTACAQAKAWQDEGSSALRVAVNLSARQFLQPNLLQQVIAVLEETGLDPTLLELEITESLLMQDVETAIATMDALKATGIRLAIDDFGTGYSSLSYLQRFPIDRLKIDRAFIKDVIKNPDSAAIAMAVVSMAHSLNMAVVAEGVESRSQQQFLKKKCCDEMQGYYLSRPLPASEFTALLQRYRKAPLTEDESRDVLADGRRAVLVVDDEARVTGALSRLLQREGYHVLSAVNAQEGLELLATHSIEVVISDQIMPGIDGAEFLSRVRDLYPDTVRIMLSGRSTIDTLIEAVNRGAIYKFLHKPANEKTLLATVREAFLICEAQRLQRQARQLSDSALRAAAIGRNRSDAPVEVLSGCR